MRFDRRSVWFWTLVAGTALLLTIVITQTVQLVSYLWSLSPLLGIVVGTLIVSSYVIADVLLYRWLTARPALVPPASTAVRARERYARNVLARLRLNPRCKDMLPISSEEMEPVLADLSREAETLIEGTSSRIFMSTAVAQSGSLETLMVIGAEFRMAGRVAEVYWGPLGLRERLFLWKYLLTSGVIFAEIEELGVVEEARPILGSLVGAALGGIPGLHVLSQLLVDAWLRGSANALLSLRVGSATIQYCTATSLRSSDVVSTTASAWASERVGDVIRTGAKELADRVAQEATKATTSGVGKLKRRLVHGAPTRPSDPTREFRS